MVSELAPFDSKSTEKPVYSFIEYIGFYFDIEQKLYNSEVIKQNDDF